MNPGIVKEKLEQIKILGRKDSISILVKKILLTVKDP